MSNSPALENLKTILRESAQRLVSSRFVVNTSVCTTGVQKTKSDHDAILADNELNELKRLARSGSPGYDFNQHLALLQRRGSSTETS